MKTKGHMIPEKQITHISEQTDWKEAVHQVLNPFFTAGITPASYEQTVIEQIEKLGPYCILRPGLALIHGPALPEITKTGLHIARCDQPVFFLHSKTPVTLLIGACAPQPEQYLQLISSLAVLLRGPYTSEYFQTLDDSQLLAHFAPVLHLSENNSFRTMQ